MGSILSSLGINGTFLVQILDFVVLFAFLRVFAWPPLVRAMEQRRQGIQDQLTHAQNEREEAVRLRDEQNRRLAEAKGEAQALLERAQRAAAEESRQLLEEARAQGERLQRQVREEIARERDAAVAALRAEVADLVLAATAQLLGRRVDAAEDRRLVEEFILAAGAPETGGRQ